MNTHRRCPPHRGPLAGAFCLAMLLGGCADVATLSTPPALALPVVPAFSVTYSSIANVDGNTFGFSLGDCTGSSCSRTVYVGNPLRSISASFSDASVRLGSDGKLYRMSFTEWYAWRINPSWSWTSSSPSRTFSTCLWNGSICQTYGPQNVEADWTIAEVPVLSTGINGPTSITEAETYFWFPVNNNPESGETFTYVWQRSTNGTSWTQVGTGSSYSKAFVTGDVSFYLRLNTTSNYGRSAVTQQYVTVASNLDPTLSISISGPTVIPVDTWCNWAAQVSGGTGPYTYAWTTSHIDFDDSNGNTFTGGNYWEQLSSIRVDVTDSANGYGHAVIYLSSETTAPSCN